MTQDRRFVLKGLAAAGLAVSTHSWARSLWSPAADAGQETSQLAVTTLVGGSALDAAFLSGVQQTLGSTGAPAAQGHRMQGLDAATFQRLNALLNDGRSSLLLGWLDDASAVIVLDLVRSAGGRVLSVQQHRTDSGAQVQALGQALVAGIEPPALQASGASYVSLRCVI